MLILHRTQINLTLCFLNESGKIYSTTVHMQNSFMHGLTPVGCLQVQCKAPLHYYARPYFLLLLSQQCMLISNMPNMSSVCTINSCESEMSRLF